MSNINTPNPKLVRMLEYASAEASKSLEFSAAIVLNVLIGMLYVGEDAMKRLADAVLEVVMTEERR